MSSKKSDVLYVNNSMTNMLYFVVFLLVIVFSLTLSVKSSITGSAVAGNGPYIYIDNYLLHTTENVSEEDIIPPTSMTSTHMTWFLESGGYFTDILFAESPQGIGGVIGVVQVNNGNPQFFGETEGTPFFNQLKEFKITALNKVNPDIAKKLAPPGYAIVNGFVIPTALEYLINTSLLPFYPGDFFIEGTIIYSPEGYPELIQGIPTRQYTKFDMRLRPCDDVTFYFIVCNHVCEISKIKRIQIQCPSGGGGGLGGRGLPCMWTAKKVSETACFNGKKDVTYTYIKNKLYCPDQPNETVVEDCSGPVTMPWPPGEPMVQGAPAQQVVQPPAPVTQPPAQNPQANLQETYQQPALNREDFEEAYLQLQQNCMSIPTFFGNVKACWD